MREAGRDGPGTYGEDEEDQGEIGAVQLSYPHSVPFAARSIISDEDIIVGFHNEALNVPGVTPFPEEGFDGNNKGPWWVKIKYSEALTFAEVHSSITITINQDTPDESDVTLNVRAMRLIDPTASGINSMSAPARKTFMDSDCCWIEIYLRGGTLESHKVTTNKLRGTVKTLGLQVYIAVRPQVKIKGEDGKPMALGTFARKNKVMMVVKPTQGSVIDFKWPVLIQHKEDDMHFSLRYRIGGKSAKRLCGAVAHLHRTQA